LADCLYLIGRYDDAHAMFDRLVGLRNDLGLLAEEYDVVAGRQVGNFPQAFSHVSLVNAAFNLSGQPAMEDQDVADVHLLRATGLRFGRSRTIRGFLPARRPPLVKGAGAQTPDPRHPGPPGPDPLEPDPGDPDIKTKSTKRRRAR